MQANDIFENVKKSLNCKGRLVVLDEPKVMGIINLTPDSFYDGGRLRSNNDVLTQAEEMLEAGATFLDVGGMSSRPGAEVITVEEELKRVVNSISGITMRFPNAIVSIDTVHARVAEEAVGAGACVVNDISAGSIDSQLFATVAKLKVPYILMHMQGKPADMQAKPKYQDVIKNIMDFLLKKINELQDLGVKDIIVDPGFGFGKTVEHNYMILKNLDYFKFLEKPILAGVSRKSMICKVLGVNPEKALNGTTAAHMFALQNGACILRVHDVKEAMEAIKVYKAYTEAGEEDNR